MDSDRFDQLIRSLSSGSSRRRLLTGVASGLLAVLRLSFAAEVDGKKMKRKRKKNKKRRQSNASPPPPVSCTPTCINKSCGDDGCGGSCGSCAAGQTCQGGACLCPAGAELCGGACVALCASPQVRNAATCGCCLPGGASCVIGADPCCSGFCITKDIITFAGECAA